MSKADEFRIYAEEALRGAAELKTDDEKQALIKLARTWSQAAMRAEFALRPTADTPPQVA